MISDSVIKSLTAKAKPLPLGGSDGGGLSTVEGVNVDPEPLRRGAEEGYQLSLTWCIHNDP